MSKLYDEKSIESLSPLEFTRLRPQVYVGDCEYSTQLLIEIISNSIDEFRAGHGSMIEVSIDKSKVTVIDEGQGFIPNSFREDGKTILEAAFSVLNTSGKYREDGSYEGTSLGSYGIGSKLATFLSHSLTVTTFRDGLSEKIDFVEGVFDKREVKQVNKTLHGTTVTWTPSEEFFTHTEVEINKVKDLFKTLAALCPGLTINLYIDDKPVIKYYSKNGISDLLDAAIKDKEIINNRCVMNYVDGKNKLDLVLTYTSNYSSTIVPYVNAGLTESGQHITQLKTILTREMNKFFKEKKWLKEKDENLSGDDINEGLYLIFNLTCAGVAYDAQVKSRVSKIDMKPFTSPFTEALNYWMHANEKEIKIIADKAIGARKAREAAKKARDAARAIDKKKKEKVLKFDSKLADCYSKDRKKCEIYITEGDSASGSITKSRDVNTQAVFSLRGKPLNSYGLTKKVVYENEVFNLLQAALNIEDGIEGLRYNKVIVATDADVDGMHIRLLIITFFLQFFPDLIKKGHVYILQPPLFRVRNKKKTNYCYTEDERIKAIEELGPNPEITRFKGLGEISPDEFKHFIGKDMRLEQVSLRKTDLVKELLEFYMGKNTMERQNFIIDNLVIEEDLAS